MLGNGAFQGRLSRWAWVLALATVLVFTACCGAAAAPEKAHADGLTVGSLQTEASNLALGKRVSGYVQDDRSLTYTFKTTSRHSAYAIEIISRTAGESVGWNLYDSYGNELDWASTSTNRVDKVLLATNSTYRITVSSYYLCQFSLKVSEVPSNPQYKSLGKDKNHPYSLTLGKAVNSQFDNREGSQTQYFKFRTTSRHSAYRIRLFSRMDDQSVTWNLYDSYGNQIDWNNTSTVRTDSVLLSANSTYTLRLSSGYSANSGFPSYQLKVSEAPSNPQYKALGKNKNNPYKLKLGTAVSSQFDDREGSQDQWFTFKTKSSKKYPYVIRLASKTPGQGVYWNLYDYYGNQVDWNSTDTVRTDSMMLTANMTYRIKISGSYNGDSGYTSYQLMVAQAHPSKVKGLKLKAGKKKIKVSYKAAKLATGYQIAYKKANAKSWKKVTTSKNSRTIKKLKHGKKYKVKVRAYYEVAGPYSWSDSTYYYGKWSKVKKVRVK